MMVRLAGFATEAGTLRYKERLKNTLADGHVRLCQGLWMSSVGLGTYLGHYDAETDRRYEEAVGRALELGCNVLDSAINYRLQRSERSVGAALARAVASGHVSRDEVIMATKGGFLSYDAEPPRDPSAYFHQTYIQTGLAKPEEIAAGCHCMSPRYVEDQVERSLANLGLECIDIYYIHNPETQLGEVDRLEFYVRLEAAFQALEKLVSAGRIRMYGTATWNGYRVDKNSREHLSLEEVLAAAERAGEKEHHFRVVQLPLNLALTEALTHPTQQLEGQQMTLLDAAQGRGITVMGSASIYQGQLSRKLPDFIRKHFEGLQTDAQRAIHFARSTPGLAVALVGMSQKAHVEENMAVARVPPASRDSYMGLFSRSGGSQT